jgi:hypothetical protein
MPIDARIPLMGQPVQFENPLESASKAMGLRNLMQQGQLQRQGIQQNDMALKQQQDAQRDQEIQRRAVIESNGDWDAYFTKLQQYGASPDAIFKTKQGFSAARKAAIEMDQAERDDNLKKGSAIAALMEPVDKELESQNPDMNKAAQLFIGGLQGAIQQGVMDPQQARALASRPFDPMQYKTFQNTMNLSNQILKRSEAAKNPMLPYQMQKAQSDAARSEQELKGTQPITPYQQAQLAQQGKPNTAAELAVIASDPSKTPTERDIATKALAILEKHAIASRPVTGNEPLIGAAAGAVYTGASPGVPGERNEKVLIGLPVGEANIIKGIVEGRIALPGGIALSKQPWVNRLNLAAAYDPGFDQTQWRVRLDTRVDFSKGKAAGQIRSLNTLIKHLGQLWDSADKLDNTGISGGTKAGNYLVNLGKEQFGSFGLKDWDVAASAAGGEIAALLKGGVPDKQEIEQQTRNFNRNDPKEAQHRAIIDTLHLAYGRLAGLTSQYENAYNRARDFKFTNTESENILKNKLGIDPDALEAEAGMKTGVRTARITPQDETPTNNLSNLSNDDLFKLLVGAK